MSVDMDGIRERAEAAEKASPFDGYEWAARRIASADDVPALLATVAERDEQIAALQAQLDAVRAALSEPLDTTKVLDTHGGRALWGATQASNARHILGLTPVDLLASRDARVAAEALEEARKALTEQAGERFKSGGEAQDWTIHKRRTWAAGADTILGGLRARSVVIRAGVTP